ncbi:MAG: hypothetical protein CMP16_03925 [Rickettsiales bacterium]|nr:hypothetical protein [Rickettsiales bacterium]|tara:strand:- start:171 stop:554 length:384 start_codon:yes stop_codon:yes gene_type:complete
MLLNVSISLGELLDKISILLIKEKQINNSQKQIHIKEELSLLNDALEKSIQRELVKEYIIELVNINTKLWNIEDEIRNCEKIKKFDKKFIDLARSVYLTNDIRSEIKLKINKKFGSKLVEVKSYEKY